MANRISHPSTIGILRKVSPIHPNMAQRTLALELHQDLVGHMIELRLTTGVEKEAWNPFWIARHDGIVSLGRFHGLLLWPRTAREAALENLLAPFSSWRHFVPTRHHPAVSYRTSGRCSPETGEIVGIKLLLRIDWREFGWCRSFSLSTPVSDFLWF